MVAGTVVSAEASDCEARLAVECKCVMARMDSSIAESRGVCLLDDGFGEADGRVQPHRFDHDRHMTRGDIDRFS
jgi:hypothetical protein